VKTVAFPAIAQAHIQIAGLPASVEADSKATGVVLWAKVPAGRTKLKAWFADGQGEDLCGAFFVTVKKMQ
jgi:hypothetical protein